MGENIDHQITKDLMRKVEDDVIGALRRTLSIAPRPFLPIVISAGAVCIGFVAAELELMSENGRQSGAEPDPDAVMLAGLLIARTSLGGDDPIGRAYRDLAVLIERQKEAGDA